MPSIIRYFTVTALALIPVSLFMNYLWQAGLDLQNPNEARDWVNVCARSRYDVYCKAASRVIQDIEGPVVFLRPNTADMKVTDQLKILIGRTPNESELNSIVKANIFKGSDLFDGIMKTLDGQPREIRCTSQGVIKTCNIGNLRGGIKNKPNKESDGAIYIVANISGKNYDFFLPRKP